MKTKIIKIQNINYARMHLFKNINVLIVKNIINQ